MEFRPNKTKIRATIIDILKEKDKIKLVIVELPKTDDYPDFLSLGKILTAKIMDKNSIENIKVEDIVSAEIEVLGGPRKQRFLLHNLFK